MDGGFGHNNVIRLGSSSRSNNSLSREADYGVYYEPYEEEDVNNYGQHYEQQYEQGQHYENQASIASYSPDVNGYELGVDTSGLAGSMGSLGFNRSKQYGSLSGRLATLGRVQAVEKFKDLSLNAVIELLENGDQIIAANAAAYLQHLTYNNSDNKTLVRQAGGIEALVSVLEDRKAVDRIVEHAAGALRNASYGCNENKIAIKECEGISALLKVLRQRKSPMIRVHTTGALWNLSSHQALKQALLDQVLNDVVEMVLLPYADDLKRGVIMKDHPGLDQAFINCSGLVRNLSSHSDAARRRMRESVGLLDSLCDIIDYVSETNADASCRGVEGTICALRNLTFRIHREASSSKNRVFIPPLTVEEQGCFFRTRTVQAPYREPPIPDASRAARGVERLLQISILGPLVYLMHNSTNPQTIEASIGIVQNLTADHFVSSAYLRAHFRKEKGLPILVEKIVDASPTISHTSIIALRNLAVDLKNKELIGKYGMREVCSHIPDAKQGHFEEKTALASLFLAKILVEYHAENAEKFEAEKGLMKVLEINTSSHHSDKLRKAAGQILQALWQIEQNRKHYKNDLGLKKTQFQVP